ncbi:MAG: hypothetical protein K2M42_03090 [Oscillospiraceae bacterium]|nr:hypothetical protein [Oscillospiraceae bacterium]
MGVFKIDADQFQWINGPEDDPNDLCLHGHVMVQVGANFFEDVGTVSATALYLLKSLEKDKIMSRYDIQMIPCCGHFLIANGDLSEVTISGCDTGTDWSILHSDGGIKIILPFGAEEQVAFPDYQAEVFRFADKIEAYYKACQPKVIPEDEFSKNGYAAFWNEWHRRRNG